MDSILAATPSRSFTMLLGSLPRKQPILVGIIPARAFVSRGPRVLPVAGVAAKGEPSRCVETLNVPELCGHASEYSHPPAEVGVDTVAELQGESERLRGTLCAQWCSMRVCSSGARWRRWSRSSS